jgi:hypothetical protein
MAALEDLAAAVGEQDLHMTAQAAMESFTFSTRSRQ